MSPSIVLVSMPWAPVPEPSLGLAILKGQLRRAGMACTVLNENVELLKHLSYGTYTELAGYWGLDEFVFTELLSPGIDEPQLEALAEQCASHRIGVQEDQRYPTAAALLDLVLHLREDVIPTYLEECAGRILAHRPTLVGMTCMFDQTLASVALAKLIKERSPGTMVVLGGYALEGPPGEQVVKAFPWIDGVARGDGEAVIAEIARASVGEADLAAIPGLLVRDRKPRPQRTINIELSPDPDYDDWFRKVESIREEGQIRIITGTLPVESSRGCWWGQTKHCVFCGIDEETLKFRHKSPGRALDMLAGLRRRYGDHEMRFSDYILPKPYFQEVLPALEAVQPRYRLQCEIKANQTAETVAKLARAGFNEVQPGIESFSSEVLKLMDKGVTAIQNVALLKYGYIERIIIQYNFLYGIPGETAEAYERMVENIPKLYHLTPPISRTEAIVTRFAPLEADPARFGGANRPVHHRCYDVLFSQAMLDETGFSLDDYAYYFERYLDFGEELAGLHAQVVFQINHWKRQHRNRPVTLDYEDDGATLRVRDSRFGEAREILLAGAERAAYLACDAAPTLADGIVREVSAELRCAPGAVEKALERLDAERLVWREGKRLIGLAIPAPVAAERIASNWRSEWVSVFR